MMSSFSSISSISISFAFMTEGRLVFTELAIIGRKEACRLFVKLEETLIMFVCRQLSHIKVLPEALTV